ncbi:MAG: GNAT family N-acetyltransferase [Niabella sp.]
MALCIIDFGSKKYQQMLDLRNEILRKPLGMELNGEDTARDADSILIGFFEEETMLGCCMLVRDEDGILLRQMAVRYNLQGKGVGRAIMNFAENIARDLGYQKIAMYARKQAQGFYEKLGYTTNGEEFVKLTIPHVVMEKYI